MTIPARWRKVFPTSATSAGHWGDAGNNLDGGKPFERESATEAAMARDICAIVIGQRRIPSR